MRVDRDEASRQRSAVEVAAIDNRDKTNPPLAASLKGRGNRDVAVRLGIDVLVADDFKQLDGKRVGLITNQTGVDSAGVTTIDRLHAAQERQARRAVQPRARHSRHARSIATSPIRVDEKTGPADLQPVRRAPRAEQGAVGRTRCAGVRRAGRRRAVLHEHVDDGPVAEGRRRGRQRIRRARSARIRSAARSSKVRCWTKVKESFVGHPSTCRFDTA